MNYAFVTGGTGFLGRRLVADLIRETDLQIGLLAREPRACQRWFAHLPQRRIEIVPGDVSKPNLGLTGSALNELRNKVTEIWHLAAVTSFNKRDRSQLMQVNVGGTQNALNLAEHCKHLNGFYYMSTGYVAGRRLSPIPEDWFPADDGFKNPYEESKYESEQVVRQSSVPWTILRPTIVMGDSDTGECEGETRMMYGFVLGVCRAVMHAFDSQQDYWEMWKRRNGDWTSYPEIEAGLVVCGSVETNLVTRDDTARVCLAVRERPSSGLTYNIANPNGLTNQQIVDQVQYCLKVRGLYPDPTIQFQPRSKRSVVERVAMRNTRPFWPYGTERSPTWDTGNVDALGVPRVRMDEALFRKLVESFVRRIAPK